MRKLLLWAVLPLMLAACAAKDGGNTTASGLSKANFETTVNGKKTDLYVLITAYTWSVSDITPEL